MTQMTSLQKFGYGAAGAIALGSLGTWISVVSIFGTIDVAGTSGDGKFTLAIASLIALLAYKGKALGVAVASVVAGLIVGHMMYSATTTAVEDGIAAIQIGWGAYLAFAGAIAGAIVGIRSRKAAVKTAVEEPLLIA